LRECLHKCHYCYARASHAYLDLGVGEDFSSRIVVKTNIAAVLRRELELARPCKSAAHERGAEGSFFWGRRLQTPWGEALYDPPPSKAIPGVAAGEEGLNQVAAAPVEPPHPVAGQAAEQPDGDRPTPFPARPGAAAGCGGLRWAALRAGPASVPTPGR
jgi:hypothetical protein